MAFVRLENFFLPLLLCAVFTTYLKPSSSQRTTTITFAAIPDPINVLRNETVEFICEQNANYSLKIKYKGNIVIVENKQIKEEFLDIFDFQMLNSTTGKLKLKHATEEYNGTYKCGEGVNEKYAAIGDVYTLISSKPICKSSIDIGPYIFEDQIDLIEMNCTSEDGIPHVTMSSHIIQGNYTTDVTSISTKTTSSHPHPSKTLSFSLYFNSSFNNSVFVCHVSQQAPAPYLSYQGSCSFGPSLFLPLFSVTANPSNINFSDIRNAVFRCTSNVSEVRLSWIKIPTHWKYDNMGSDASIELNVSDTGRGVYSGEIQCIGYYGDRNITSTIQIRATNDPENSLNHIGKQLLFALANHVLDRVDEIHVIISEVEPDEVKKFFEPEAFIKVVVYDYWTNPLGWNVSEDDTLRVNSDEDLFSGVWSTPRASPCSKIAVVIDAICSFLPYQTDSVISTSIWSLLHATKDIPEIQSVCVLGIIHADLHTEKTLNALRHLANVQIRLFTHQTNLVSIR